MIYLLLDTNVWLYLANKYDPLKKDYENDVMHFKLVTTLNELVDKDEITLLTNDIIIQEWNRNKDVTKKLIVKRKDSLEGNRCAIKNIQKYLDEEDKMKLNGLFEKYKGKIHQIIEKEEMHISQVENLLFNKTKRIDVTEEVMAVGAKRAIQKLAPFKGDKNNSMADFVILLSVIEYIRRESQDKFYSVFDEPLSPFPHSIFISFNKHDFANPNKIDEVHPELKPLFDEVTMKYEMNIGNALNQVKADLIKQEEIEQIMREIEDGEYWKTVYICDFCTPNGPANTVDFYEPISIRNELKEIEIENPNQIKLFDLEEIPMQKKEKVIAWSDINTIQLGSCNYCGCEYFKCQYCGAVNSIPEWNVDSLECEGCGLPYQINYHYGGEGMNKLEIMIVNDSTEEEDYDDEEEENGG